MMMKSGERLSLTWNEALARIAGRAGVVAAEGIWPADSVADLVACGAMGWAIPVADGGSGMDAVVLHECYEQLCAACLTTGLVFTQRDAAVGHLVAAERTETVSRLLREMARGERFATIGISQLTTSRQHLPPAVRALAVEGGFVIDGAVPWVTSLHHNDRVIVGAVLPDRMQVLVALDVRAAGVAMSEAMRLASLTGSDTGELRLKDVRVAVADVIAGPSENVLAARNAVRGFTTTTCILPLGVAGGAISQARELAAGRSAAYVEAVKRLAEEHRVLRGEVYAVGVGDESLVTAKGAELRARANTLAARASLAALELAKGHGFLAGEAAQRRAREAMFFFVWSSPPAVIEKTLRALAVR
jgi:alkylation response protein AidB-like acyl-CoA dehydrogenase